MSGYSTGWDDPYRTGFAGKMYDPGTMYGLVLQAGAGDNAARNHLFQTGFLDSNGNSLYGDLSNPQQAVGNWAKSQGLSTYNGANPFQWNNTWTNASAPGFTQAWQSAFSGQPGTQPTAPANNGQPTQTPQSSGSNAWANQIPEWTEGGGYPVGRDYVNGRWVPKGPMAAGTPVGAEVGWNTGLRLPGVYDSRVDNSAFEYKGAPQELAIARAIRKTADAVRGNPNLNAQHVFEYLLANFDRDSRKGGKNSGFAPGTFADVAYGEAYDPNKQYVAGGGGGGGSASPAAPAAPGQPVAGSGGGSTAPVASPSSGLPAGYQGQNGGTTGQGSGQLTAAQRMALSDDPNQAYRYMMQQLGYNPSAPGLLGSFLKKRFQPLLEARLAASNVGDNANYMDQLDQVINEFGGGLFQKGGNFFGNLRNAGQQAAQQGAGFLNNLQDQNQAMQYLNQLGMLNYAGGNPLVQQSVADEMNRAREGYQDESFNRELTGQNLDPFQQWLMQQQRYKGLFGY